MDKKSKKISIYQVLPRLFGNNNTTRTPSGSMTENGVGKMNHFTPQALQSIADLGCTHVWYTGLLEHATLTAFPEINVPADHHSIVKGEAGSPYAIKDYYDISPSLAVNAGQRHEEFDELIARTHAAGLGVIIDFVPNHVSRCYHSDSRPPYIKDFGSNDNREVAFSPSNNFYYLPLQTLLLNFGFQQEHQPYSEFPAKVTGNNCFSASPSINDWYETVKLNYGIDYMQHGTTHFDPIPDTWHKMLDILNYWIAKGIDGFRCDMAEMVPTKFWTWAITQIKKHHPHIIFIAEVYQPHLYQDYISSGFDYLYDKVGLYDTLVRIIKGEAPASDITHSWQATERFYGHMLHFMENHDEQRLASDFIAHDPLKAFPAMALSTLIDTAPIMTYFGQEVGERGMDSEGFSGKDGRTSIFDYWSLDTIIRWRGTDGSYQGRELSEPEQQLRKRYQNLLRAAIGRKAFTQGRFFDLMYANTHHKDIDPSKHFSFLRTDGQDIALVVVNFGDQPAHLSITIPQHAFDVLRLQNNQPMLLTDIMKDLHGVGTISSTTPFEIEVGAYDVTIYYFENRHQPHNHNL